MSNTNDPESPSSGSAILEKICRLKNGGKLRVLDLFAGCGGLSLGFERAGFELVGAVEHDAEAAYTHAFNFKQHLSPELQLIHSEPKDIVGTDPDQLSKFLQLGPLENSVDVVIGGPPCQSFARIGRAKLRHLSGTDISGMDARSSLYLRFLTYVRDFRPLVVLMENVPDILSFAGHRNPDLSIPLETSIALDEAGYEVSYTLLNSVHYGVPQFRKRFFLIAFAKELGIKPTFPAPTHSITLPKGYENMRAAAKREVRFDLFMQDTFYVDPPEASKDLPPAVTVGEALGDLPEITEHLNETFNPRSWQVSSQVQYQEDLLGPSNYPEQMRMWPGHSADSSTTAHITRILPRDFPIFEKMRPGDTYPEAVRIAQELLEEKISRLTPRPRSDSPEFLAAMALTVPPYPIDQFQDKWRKLDPTTPSHTLTAHLSKDTYSHIHPTQSRTISVREAARLQSFPDGFRFFNNMGSAFRQIGNSVPPLLAYALADEIKNAVSRALEESSICKTLEDEK